MQRKRFFRRHRLLSLAGVLAVPVLGVSAYFLASGIGSGTGHFQNGGSPSFTWTVTLAAPQAVDGPLSPGSGTQVVPVSVSDTTGSTQSIGNGTVSVDHDGAGGIFDTVSNAFVDGCQASWFSAILSSGGNPMVFPYSVPSSGGAFSVFVTMPANATTDQSACENLAPRLTVSLS